jgi:hypothetical protein
VPRGRGTRRKRAAVAAVLATLGTGTLSWAAATGRLEQVLARVGLADPPRLAPIDAPAPRPSLATTRTRDRGDTPSDSIEPDVGVVAEAAPPPAPQPPAPVATPKPVPRPRATAVTTDADADAYRAAHAAHFHGDDAAVAIAAWDRYLVAHPDGRFAVEARYNRAVALVRARRFDDAAAALGPFARGEVDPPGYRKTDALRILTAIEREGTERDRGGVDGQAGGAP